MIEKLAQKQLDCYNNHDLDGFLSCYAENVEIYDQATGALKMSGKAEMSVRYQKRFESKVHAKLENRMVLGKQAIDYEYVTSIDREPVRAIAIYLEEDNLIAKVWFIHE